MVDTSISDFFASQKMSLQRCLDPTMSCKSPAIKAHSVQNANALEFIQEGNHVYELSFKIRGGEPNCSFSSIGRRNASTFTGLCAGHDSEIFRPIDTKPLSVDDREQLFLIAYRSVTRELHVTMESAMRIQMTYKSLVKKGRASSSEPDLAGFEATQHMLKAWGTWKYRRDFFDINLIKQKFSEVRHSIFKIEGEQPAVAASSFFSVDAKPWGKPFSAAIVNVIPTGATETTVIFSYARAHSGKVRKFIAPVMLAKGDKRKQELSHLLIDRAENFFISPVVFNGWSGQKRRAIEAAFSRSIFGEKLNYSPELLLF